MQDESQDQQPNDQSDANRQQEQAQIPAGQGEQADVQKIAKSEIDFKGIAAHRWLKKKIFDIINGGK